MESKTPDLDLPEATGGETRIRGTGSEGTPLGASTPGKIQESATAPGLGRGSSTSDIPIEGVSEQKLDEVLDLIRQLVGASKTSESEQSGAQPPTSDMTRDELKAHLEANEERVGRMTDRVEERLDHLSDQVDSQFERLGDKMEHIEGKQGDLKEDLRTARSTMVLGFLALAALLVSMLAYGYQRMDTLANRVFENAQQIEQVERGTSSSGAAEAPQDTSGQ